MMIWQCACLLGIALKVMQGHQCCIAGQARLCSAVLLLRAGIQG